MAKSSKNSSTNSSVSDLDQRYNLSVSKLKRLGASNSGLQISATNPATSSPNEQSLLQIPTDKNTTPASEILPNEKGKDIISDFNEFKTQFKSEMLGYKNGILMTTVAILLATSVALFIGVWTLVNASVSDAKSDFRDLLNDFRGGIQRDLDDANKKIENGELRLQKLESQQRTNTNPSVLKK